MIEALRNIEAASNALSMVCGNIFATGVAQCALLVWIGYEARRVRRTLETPFEDFERKARELSAELAEAAKDEQEETA